MTCRNCGYSEFPFDYRTWYKKESCFTVLLPMNVIHADEVDIEIFGPRVACYFVESWTWRNLPQGDLHLRDQSQRRRN